jgi:NADH:ubiquinone oxidoreductase subunit E/NAD-dependent dihydropyrimidine dehydrogenase PreA subunit
MSKTNGKKKVGAVLVQGGGIAGVQASLDLANSGLKVYLLEQSPVIGGMMARLDKTFPTGDCATCMVSPKLVECARNLNIEILTLSELQKLEGEPGNFKATVKRKPRYVNEDKCTGCGVCTQVCPVKYQIYHAPEEKPTVDLTPEDRQKVDAIVSRHQGSQGALMPVLKEINSEFNYLPEDVLRYVSVALDVPLSLIYRIATFYNAFSLTPRGRHTISVCAGTTCYVRGADKLLDRLKGRLKVELGGTTADRRFTLETVRCLGCCSLAPVISVDGEIYGNLKGNDVLEVLEAYE